MFFRAASKNVETQNTEALMKAIDRVQAVIWFDLDGNIVDANQSFLSVVEYSLEEIRGKHHRIFVDARYAASPAYSAFWERLRRGEFVRGEFERFGRNGKEIWLEACYTPVQDETGKTVRIAKFAFDITAAKRQAADTAGQVAAIGRSQAVIEFDLEGNILTANDNFLSVMGYALEEIRGKHHRIFLDPAQAAAADYAHFWDDLAQGKFKAGEFRRIGRGGREVWIQASYNPILDHNGRPLRVVKYASDITEAKSRAADVSSQIAAISKSQAVIEFQLDGTILTANDNFLQAMGYTLAEVKGRHHSMFMPEDEVRSSCYQDFWKSLREGHFQAAEYRRIAKGGRDVWIQASYNPIFDTNGKPVKVVKYATDVTARKLAINALSDSITHLSKGNLSARIPDSVTGEFATLRAAFNETMVRLEQLVSGILETSRTIAGDSEAIASNANNLATRSERQAATVEETSAAMQEIATAVQRAASNAAQADTEARTASRHADTGGGVVGEAIAAMTRIEQRAQQIESIVQVIDSIAFQTNLLALNAGVEAARAGEDGRGFAVVASEVRALAQRTTDAARDIKELIEASNKEVREGSQLVGRTGEALSEIVTAMGGVVRGIAEISNSGREQAAGIGEVTEAVNNIDRATQHTAALAEEGAAAASELATRSAELRKLVSFFQLSGAQGGNVASIAARRSAS